ncbi:MAG: hypothetical protein R3B82_03365 [Sandaracinaceae bacterium]
MLLLWGREDRVTAVSWGERLQNELADARLRVYPRCGHFPMIEAARPSLRDLREFLDVAPPAPVLARRPTPPPTSIASERRPSRKRRRRSEERRAEEISRRREGAESGISRRREGATGISFANPFAPRRLCERFLFAPLVTALAMLAAISAPSTTEAQE